MAQADKKHIGTGSQGKRSGTGAETKMPEDKVGPNDVLSNRDKAQHPKTRGLDSKTIRASRTRTSTASNAESAVRGEVSLAEDCRFAGNGSGGPGGRQSSLSN
jgi:hypothetical protein